MYMCVDPTRQNQLTGCVQLLLPFELSANLYDDALCDADVGGSGRTRGSDNLAISYYQIHFSHVAS
jgi:hypothetical protein